MSNKYNTGNMSVETSNISAPAVLAPVGTASISVGGEFQSFGPNPVFSGLARSDSNIGPVSFTNSTDLFAETKAFGTPSFGTPETPVKGDIFGQTEIIAQGVNQESAEQAIADQITQPNLEDLRISDPLTYQQLKSDLEIVDNILVLVDQVNADRKTIVEISNQAVQTAVARSGLVQEALKNPQESTEEKSEEPEPESGTQVEVQQTRTDEQTEEVQTPPVPQNKKEQGSVRDEDANETRIEHRNKALRQAAQEDVDPVTGKLSGEAVIERVISNGDEQSDLAMSQGVDDGSIPEADRVIAESEFEKMDQAERVIFESVEDNTGVKRGNAGQKATEDEVRKVLKGNKVA